MLTKNNYSVPNQEGQCPADQLTITFYTDPLCCWSVAMDPHLQRLKNDLPGLIHLNYCMCGMIADWNTYSDPLNNVKEPCEMGDVWRKAQHETGVAINGEVWQHDPPHSSYPSCLAVKTAGLQSALAEELMLQQLREAVMIQGLNIAREEVLSEVADKLAEQQPCFDLKRFKKDYDSTKSRRALKHDLEVVKKSDIGRFPTLALDKEGYDTVTVTGYIPYETLAESLKYMF
jgi:putative protein-disulfide isomerase